MSQLRAHRNPNRSEKTTTRARSSMKAAGDAAEREKHEEQSKSRSKIPKTIRYELESALVGLCDVWFSEIKPHLVRNNIKLHVNHSPPAAGGDHETIPPGAPGCCHLDPGAASDRRRVVSANSAGCYSTRRTASTAPYPRQPAPVPARSQQLPPAQIPKISDESPRKIGRRRRRRPRARPCALEWRTPRECHTYCAPPALPARPAPRARTADQINTRSKFRRRKINSGTQTDETLIVPKTTARSKLDINLLPTKTKEPQEQDRVKKKCKVSKFSAPPSRKIKLPLWPSLRSVSPLKSPITCRRRQLHTARPLTNNGNTMTNLRSRRWETNTTLRPDYKPYYDDFSSPSPASTRRSIQTVRTSDCYNVKAVSNQKQKNSGVRNVRTAPTTAKSQPKTGNVGKPLFTESLINVIDHNFKNYVDVLYESPHNPAKRSEFNLVMNVDNAFRRRPWKY